MPTGAIAGAEAQSARLVIMDPKEADAQSVRDVARASPSHRPGTRQARTELPAPSPRMFGPGDTAPTQVDDATPGHTPPRSPVPQVSPPALLRWHETRPPTTDPGERCCWLYVPLLHAAAGFLSDSAYAAWSGEPEIGERWLAMVVALRSAPPSPQQALANAIHTVAELEARHAEEQAVADLLALPPHPLPLPTAVALCQSQDGYLTAATQAALLEVFGGSVVAAAALALAEDVRAIHGRRATNQGSQCWLHGPFRKPSAMHKPLEPCDFHTWAAATALHFSGSGTADGTGVHACVTKQDEETTTKELSFASKRLQAASCAQQSMLMQHGPSKAATTPCCAPGRASLPSGLFARGSCAPRGANAGTAWRCRARKSSSAWLRCRAMCGVFLWNPVGAGEARAGHSLRVSRWPRCLRGVVTDRSAGKLVLLVGSWPILGPTRPPPPSRLQEGRVHMRLPRWGAQGRLQEALESVARPARSVIRADPRAWRGRRVLGAEWGR